MASFDFKFTNHVDFHVITNPGVYTCTYACYTVYLKVIYHPLYGMNN